MAFSDVEGGIEPNPFQEEFSLKFDLDASEKVAFRFYDMTGKLLHFIEKTYTKGNHEERVNIGDIGSNAIVYCQMIVEEKTSTQKIVKCD
jgi:hypothetical protein